MAELGLGIHGEAGVEQVAMEDANDAISKISEKLSVNMPQTPHAVLINNLGGASCLEMAILTKNLLSSDFGKHIQLAVGPSTMMTALDMHGFSITMFELADDDEAFLQQEADVLAWPGCHKVQTSAILPLPDGLTPIRAPASAHEPTKEFLINCCKLLIASENDLNLLDAKSGDGDTGSTLAGASRALIDVIDTLPLSDHTQLYRSIGLELSQTMGGSSGVLLAIFFAAAGDASSSGMTKRDALIAGLDRMCQIGGAKAGDRTMVDALQPALEVLDDGLLAAARAARKGAEFTASLTSAKVGRAS